MTLPAPNHLHSPEFQCKLQAGTVQVQILPQSPGPTLHPPHNWYSWECPKVSLCCPPPPAAVTPPKRGPSHGISRKRAKPSLENSRALRASHPTGTGWGQAPQPPFPGHPGFNPRDTSTPPSQPQEDSWGSWAGREGPGASPAVQPGRRRTRCSWRRAGQSGPGSRTWSGTAS